MNQDGTNKRSESAKKAVSKRPEGYFKEIGSKGGKNSTHRPMRDPEYARKLAALSAKKRRENKLKRLEEEKLQQENAA